MIAARCGRGRRLGFAWPHEPEQVMKRVLTELHHPENSNPQTFEPHPVDQSIVSEDINGNTVVS